MSRKTGFRYEMNLLGFNMVVITDQDGDVVDVELQLSAEQALSFSAEEVATIEAECVRALTPDSPVYQPVPRPVGLLGQFPAGW